MYIALNQGLFSLTEMGRGVITKLSTLLEDDDIDEAVDEEETLEGEVEGDEEPEEGDGNEYSDDSSEEVDV